MARCLIIKNKLEGALRVMKPLPGFSDALVRLVQDEAYHEANNILQDKDPPVRDFNLDSLRKFSYKEQLSKLQRTNPILVACVKGSIKKVKVKSDKDLRRKGFGGNAREGFIVGYGPTFDFNID